MLIRLLIVDTVRYGHRLRYQTTMVVCCGLTHFDNTVTNVNKTVTHLKSNVPCVDSIRQLANMSGVSPVSFIRRCIIKIIVALGAKKEKLKI